MKSFSQWWSGNTQPAPAAGHEIAGETNDATAPGRGAGGLAIIQSALDCIICMNAEGRITAFNPAAERTFGYRSAAVLGRRLSEVIIPPRFREHHGRALASYLTTGIGTVLNRRLEAIAIRADGSEFPIELAITESVQDGSRMFIGFVRDISDRKQHERLIEERCRVSAMTSAISDALICGGDLNAMLQGCTDSLVRHLGAAFARIWIVDSQGETLLLVASSGLYTHLDGEHSRVPIGKYKIGLIAQERKPHLTNSVVGDPRVGDQQWAQREGMVAFAGYPLVVDDRLLGVMALFARSPLSESVLGEMGSAAKNIALGIEHKRSEQALRERESRLRSVIESPIIGIIFWDKAGAVCEVNETFLRMVGHRREDLLSGRINWKSLTPEEYTPLDQRAFEEIARDGACKPYEKEYFRSDGSRVSVLKAACAIGENRDTRAAFVLDISQRLSAEAALQSAQKQLLQAQKMEAVGRLAGGVAHDFNNLLTVILGYSELLGETLSANDPLRGPIEAIGDAGQRAASLTRQLLAFSRQTVLEPRLLDLNGIVRETEKMLRRLIGEDVQLTTVLAPELDHVKVDPSQMDQVLVNLAVNARDAMPQGGMLTIETSNVEVDEDYARLHPEVKPGKYARLTVTDTGCGMEPDVRMHIFEPFFTTKAPGKGTGLGLPTVYGIIKQSGGHIEVYSELGYGSTFKILMPAAAAPDPRREITADEHTAYFGTETILVVEDEDIVRRLVVGTLEQHGYTTLQAASGSEALSVFDEHQANFDLVVTDLVMPGMNGRQLAEIIHLRSPETRVLYMSGYTDDAVIRHGILEADVAFLQKPFTPTSLAKKVREVLDCHATVPI